MELEDEIASDLAEFTEESSTSDLDRSAFSPTQEQMSSGEILAGLEQITQDNFSNLLATKLLVDDIPGTPPEPREDSDLDSDGSSDTVGNGDISFNEFGGRAGSLLEELRNADFDSYVAKKRLQVVEEQNKNLMSQLGALEARLSATENQMEIERYENVRAAAE